MDDFWIGDLVFDQLSGLKGKYEGRDSFNKVMLKTAGKTVFLSAPQLRLMTDAEQKEFNRLTEPKLPESIRQNKQNAEYSDTIDLHIEKLDPKLITKRQEVILHRQISAARKFIEDSIRRKQYKVTIIHGKGTGALKMEIDMLLQNFTEVSGYKSSNDGGATIVTLKYPFSGQQKLIK